MRLADFWSAFPYILLAIIILSFLGAGLWKVILVLSIGGWVSEARTVRGAVLSTKEEPYVLAVEAIGATGLVQPQRMVHNDILVAADELAWCYSERCQNDITTILDTFTQAEV